MCKAPTAWSNSRCKHCNGGGPSQPEATAGMDDSNNNVTVVLPAATYNEPSVAKPPRKLTSTCTPSVAEPPRKLTSTCTPSVAKPSRKLLACACTGMRCLQIGHRHNSCDEPCAWDAGEGVCGASVKDQHHKECVHQKNVDLKRVLTYDILCCFKEAKALSQKC